MLRFYNSADAGKFLVGGYAILYKPLAVVVEGHVSAAGEDVFELVQVGFFENSLAELAVELDDFGDEHASFVAGLEAIGAADGLVVWGLGWFGFAFWAKFSQQTLVEHGQDAGSYLVGFDAHLQQA